MARLYRIYVIGRKVGLIKSGRGDDLSWPFTLVLFYLTLPGIVPLA